MNMHYTELVAGFKEELIHAELSERTVKKYVRDINAFLGYLQEENLDIQDVNKEVLLLYKKRILEKYKVGSANTIIVAVNKFLIWFGAVEIGIKTEKVQRKSCMDNVLSRTEYDRLLNYAINNGYDKYYLIMRVLAGTGIRIGELQFITKEAARNGYVSINNKGKWRDIYIADETCVLLLKFCRKNKISGGIVFFGRTIGKPLDQSSIWRVLKRIAKQAGVEEDKVYPHSFRHLFAKSYMAEIGNIAELADILGHTSIETTRIYTLTTSTERRCNIGRLQL